MVFSVWKNYFSFSLKQPNRLSRPIPASTIQTSILIDEFSVTAVGRVRNNIQKRSTLIYTIVLFWIMNLLLLRFMQMSTLLLVLLEVGILNRMRYPKRKMTVGPKILWLIYMTYAPAPWWLIRRFEFFLICLLIRKWVQPIFLFWLSCIIKTLFQNCKICK